MPRMLTKHFSEEELRCKCGCGKLKADPKLLALLERIREILGLPLIINSGYRCPVHNKRVGGVPNSYHTQGLAADIRCPSMTADELWRQVRILALNGYLPELGGLGRYTGRIHVDVRPKPDPGSNDFAEWDYRGRG